MSTGCAAATAIVRYMRSWFRAPRTGTPSAAAWARILSRSVRIWVARGKWVVSARQLGMSPYLSVASSLCS